MPGVLQYGEVRDLRTVTKFDGKKRDFYYVDVSSVNEGLLPGCQKASMRASRASSPFARLVPLQFEKEDGASAALLALDNFEFKGAALRQARCGCVGPKGWGAFVGSHRAPSSSPYAMPAAGRPLQVAFSNPPKRKTRDSSSRPHGRSPAPSGGEATSAAAGPPPRAAARPMVPRSLGRCAAAASARWAGRLVRYLSALPLRSRLSSRRLHPFHSFQGQEGWRQNSGWIQADLTAICVRPFLLLNAAPLLCLCFTRCLPHLHRPSLLQLQLPLRQQRPQKLRRNPKATQTFAHSCSAGKSSGVPCTTSGAAALVVLSGQC